MSRDNFNQRHLFLCSSGTVERGARSRMNVCFRVNGTDGTPSQQLEEKFFAEGKKLGLVSWVATATRSPHTSLHFIDASTHLYKIVCLSVGPSASNERISITERLTSNYFSYFSCMPNLISWSHFFRFRWKDIGPLVASEFVSTTPCQWKKRKNWEDSWSSTWLKTMSNSISPHNSFS